MRTILLNPGPVNVSERVRQALLAPDMCHREPEFFDLQDAIRRRLLEVFGVEDGYTSVLLTGSGTAMVEAMVSSGLPDGGRLLVVQNGVYGERMAQMARAHRIECGIVECAWTERPSIDAVDRALTETRYDALAIALHETTTGLLNDLGAVAARCRAHGVRLLVDAVSGLAGEPFDFHLEPDAVACTANKCVQGLPGVSFVLVRHDFMRDMASYPERSLYLHLPRHHGEQERRSTPFTPSIPIAYALSAALEELRDETVAGRIARYRKASTLVRDGLERLGLELLLPAALRSATLTAVTLPPATRYSELHDSLKRQGFVIYAGQGRLAATLFRVATMGDVSIDDYRRFLDALGAVVCRT